MLNLLRETALITLGAVAGHQLSTEELSVALRLDQWEKLLTALGEVKFRYVAELIRTIRKQVGLSSDYALTLAVRGVSDDLPNSRGAAPRQRRRTQRERIIDDVVEVLIDNNPLAPRHLVALLEGGLGSDHQYKIETLTAALNWEVKKPDARLVRAGRGCYAVSPAEYQRRALPKFPV